MRCMGRLAGAVPKSDCGGAGGWTFPLSTVSRCSSTNWVISGVDVGRYVPCALVASCAARGALAIVAARAKPKPIRQTTSFGADEVPRIDDTSSAWDVATPLETEHRQEEGVARPLSSRRDRAPARDEKVPQLFADCNCLCMFAAWSGACEECSGMIPSHSSILSFLEHGHLPLVFGASFLPTGSANHCQYGQRFKGRSRNEDALRIGALVRRIYKKSFRRRLS